MFFNPGTIGQPESNDCRSSKHGLAEAAIDPQNVALLCAAPRQNFPLAKRHSAAGVLNVPLAAEANA